MANQFIRLGSYGRCPRKGEPKWACISGVTAEGARAPGACNHVAHVVTPNILHGISPIEAGRLAEERACKAKDATCRRRLRKDGVALLAGVVSYPHERSLFDACDWDIYNLWCQMTIAWLNAQFGDHLLSVVEHRDEKFVHLHYYVVPTLDDRSRLNINHLHPGRYAKVVAEAEGASKKNGERSYRKAMRAWQDSFHSEVSAFFRHDRYGPDRERVTAPPEWGNAQDRN